MSVLKTGLSENLGLSAVRAAIMRLLPHLSWRRHGIGVLQAYIFEGDYEVRVHIWSRDLMVPGIDDSGNAHNHRFRLRSTVLAGMLDHTEYVLIPGDDYELYDFPNARSHTEENRCEMRQLKEYTGAEPHRFGIPCGQTYTFERGAYHTSEPVTSYVVTLIEKIDQVDEPARVLAPRGIPPVPAFSGANLTSDQLSSHIVAAQVALEAAI